MMERIELSTLYLSPKEFEKMVDVVGCGRTIINKVIQEKNATTYYYEDLTEDMDGVIKDIFTKARIPFQIYEIRSEKFGSKYLADMVANPAELTQVIVTNTIPTTLILDTKST